ncbi:hypothetical protein F383_10374 [Gossypium arboreum]|nr:hypothetical protein F383_10374 [Gossypium arboreum]
MSNWSVL